MTSFIPYLAVLGSIFLVMAAIVSYLPQLLAWYREHSSTILNRTSRELNRFFIDIEPTRIMTAAVVFGTLLGWLTDSWIFAGAMALAGVFAPKVLLEIWKNIRSGQFENQLMDALILLNNSLKSGLDMAAGFELITTNMKAPISEEFGLVLNSYRLGAPLEEALVDLTKRIRSRTLETVVSAIVIQRETGGNIVKTFEQLIVTIREESKLQKKIKALTSQGRMQVMFLAVFPWVIGAVFFLMSPELMLPALQSSIGQIVLVFLVVWEIIGIVVAKKIVTVEI